MYITFYVFFQSMSNNTKMISAFSIYDAEEGCLVERNDNVNLIYLNRTEKVIKYQEVISHMNATVNIKISQNTTIFQSKINETIFKRIVNSLSKFVVFCKYMFSFLFLIYL